SSRRRHTRSKRDWSSDVCSPDLSTARPTPAPARNPPTAGAAPRRAAIAWDTIGEKRASTPMIEAHGLTKRYGDKLAVDNVSFTEIGRASCRERVIGRVGTGHGTG